MGAGSSVAAAAGASEEEQAAAAAQAVPELAICGLWVCSVYDNQLS